MRGYEVKKTTYKKRELFTYERILYSLSIFNYLTLSSLLVIGINPKATYKIIDK